ncbi:MAG: glycoside hydrolase family 16 protein [Pseudomonadota bacterium]
MKHNARVLALLVLIGSGTPACEPVQQPVADAGGLQVDATRSDGTLVTTDSAGLTDAFSGQDRSQHRDAAGAADASPAGDAAGGDARTSDAHALDAGSADRIVADAQVPDGDRPDAQTALDAAHLDTQGAAPDLAATQDAATPADAGLFDAASEVTGLSMRYWVPTFSDDFRGKPDTSTENNECYDTMQPRCAVWTGSQGNDCATPWGGGGPVDGAYFSPLRENMAAAIAALDSSRNWASESWDVVHTRYAELVQERLRHLNKCVWTSYEQLNWWGTDYQGNWSTRHDPTRVLVDPAGKGYLHLSAVHAPVQANCVYGGVVSGPGEVNCQLLSFAAGVLHVGVSYWVDADPRWPGVYYAGVSGTCPYGGSGGSPNCLVHAFALEDIEAGPSYWVDSNPAFPGVYYANDSPYRCRENTEYPGGGVLFRALTCPLLTGAIQSADAPPVGSATLRRGFDQLHGRFEAKLRIPRGPGAFPAAWLMPRSGGWPYSGGEIDIVEARDAADEVFQTYHHGRCVAEDWLSELLTDPGNPLLPIDSGRCASLTGYRSLQLSKGVTTRQRSYAHGPTPSNEFFTRDHVFAVEWDEDEIRYSINNVHVHTVTTGTVAGSVHLLNGPALPVLGAPLSYRTFAAHNLPTQAMYWILNHSVYVPSTGWTGFVPQDLRVDYVRTLRACTTHADFCPCGGRFVEGTGCVLDSSAQLQCPAGTTSPGVVDGVYASSCAPTRMECVAGGVPFGPNCQVHAFADGVLRSDVSYWADADPRWPGVFYAGVNGTCPHGGSGGNPNCQLLGFAGDLLEDGVIYWVDSDPRWPGVYYEPDFR